MIVEMQLLRGQLILKEGNCISMDSTQLKLI